MCDYINLFISAGVLVGFIGCADAAKPSSDPISRVDVVRSNASSTVSPSSENPDEQILSRTNSRTSVAPTVDPEHVRLYDVEFRRCKSEVVPRENPRELLDPYVLASAHAVFQVEGYGELRVDDELGQGMYGKVFTFFETSEIILKGAKSDHGRDDLCWERSLQRVLQGLNGGAPRDHVISRMPAEFDPLFRNRVLVMDRRGDAEWGDVVLEEDALFYTRFAKLLTIVRDLHRIGFIHDDIKGCNIRITRTNPQDVILIDFGQAIPYIDAHGNLLPEVSRKRDLVNLIQVAGSVRGPKTWLAPFTDAIGQSSDTDEFGFDHWIEIFRRLIH